MKTSKQLHESKRQNNPPLMFKNRSISRDHDLIDLFPLPRYFQVHFQHIHENVDDLKGELGQLKQVMANVDEKLERLTALLNRLPDDRL